MTADLLTVPAPAAPDAPTDSRNTTDNRAKGRHGKDEIQVHETAQTCARCGHLIGTVGYGPDRDRPLGHGCYATARTCREWVTQ